MTKRQWWQRPQIRRDEEDQLHRKVSWLELFFDLVFVVVIAELAHDLASHINLAGVGKFILLFIPVYWVWIGATYYSERFETEGLDQRLFTFLKMIPVSGLAIFAHYALDKTATGFALSYALANSIIAYMWFRSGYHERVFRPTAKRFVTGYCISISLFVISIFVPAPGKFVLWIIGLLVDVITPLLTIKLQAALPKFSTSKLPERYGLFMIIVLGESIVGTVQGMAKLESLSLTTAIAGILGMALAFGMWSIYFDFVARRPAKTNTGSVFAWAYLHIPLVIAIAATGAGVLNVVGNEEAILPNNVRLLIACSVAISLTLIGLLENTLQRDKDEPTHPKFSPGLKFGSAVVALLLGFFGIGLPPLALLTMLVFLLLIQIGYGVFVWFSQ